MSERGGGCGRPGEHDVRGHASPHDPLAQPAPRPPSFSPTAHLVEIPEVVVDERLIDDEIEKYDREFFWSRAYLK